MYVVLELSPGDIAESSFSYRDLTDNLSLNVAVLL